MAKYFTRMDINFITDDYIHLLSGIAFKKIECIEYKKCFYPLAGQYKDYGLKNDRLYVKNNKLMHIPKELEIKNHKALDEFID
ncbi:TPA: hypothetical protein RTG66_001580 [Campylobacter jejuni]|nr:hypothetical protein [Campylobacter jejuni]